MAEVFGNIYQQKVLDNRDEFFSPLVGCEDFVPFSMGTEYRMPEILFDFHRCCVGDGLKRKKTVPFT